LVGNRTEGPLFRTRTEFARPLRSSLASREELVTGYDDWLSALPRDAVHTQQDRKAEFRRFLRTLGGVTPDQLAVKFEKVIAKIPGAPKISLYDMRRAVTQAMKDSGMPHLNWIYFTSSAIYYIL